MNITDHLERLEAARAGLVERSVSSRIAALGAVGGRFTDPSDPLREEALASLPGESGFSESMSLHVLEHMASDWTTARLEELVHAEFSDPSALERFTFERGRSVRANPGALTAHFVGGAVPGVGVNALIRSLLVGSPTLLRPGASDTILPTLFLRGLRESDPTIADACAIERWATEDAATTDTVLSRADTVVVYGSDAVVADLRARCPVTTRFVAHHHRTGIAVVGPGALAPDHLTATAADLARAVAVFDQRGCVCPSIAFVVTKDPLETEALATATAAALGEVVAEWPPGESGNALAGAMPQLMGTWELLHADGAISMHPGRATGSGVVLIDSDGVIDPPGAGRALVIRPVAGWEELRGAMAPLKGHLQTVGFADPIDVPADDLDAITSAGASRLVPISQMAFPPPWWLHDGRGPLTELVTWAENSTREF